MKKGATDFQKLLDTVTAIAEFQQENGYLPTVRDLAILLGITVDPAHKRLQNCVAAGLLRKVNRHYIPIGD